MHSSCLSLGLVWPRILPVFVTYEQDHREATCMASHCLLLIQGPHLWANPEACAWHYINSMSASVETLAEAEQRIPGHTDSYQLDQLSVTCLYLT